MKNPNSFLNRIKAKLAGRWKGVDYPGGEARFQVLFFAKDLATFVLVPVLAMVFTRALSADSSPERRKRQESRKEALSIQARSQIVVFSRSGAKVVAVGPSKRAPGTLVKLKLLNMVEAYSSTPVHARIMDDGLGGNFIGGTLIGDGSGDSGVQRINITFRIARDRNQQGVAFPIAARALSLDGTLGIVALKKEGAFARSVYNGAAGAKEDAQAALDSMDLKSVVIRALSAGLLQEFGSGAGVERNRSQVLTLRAGTEFFAELTDYFPSEGK